MKSFINTLKGKLLLGGIGVVVIAAVIVTVIVATSDKSYRSIKVNGLTGTTVITDESNVSENAYKGMNLKSGYKVEVSKDSNMTLLFDSDKYMFADEGTVFRVEASGNSEKGNTKTRIILEEGSVLCRIDKKLGESETYEVETPNSVMSVRGTIFKMTIYKNEKGENYARVDVLEGAVKVDLYNENGEKTGEEGLIEAGQAATVHSNPEISEFVIGESDIDYDDFSEAMATFVVETVDNGREICIGNDLFKHYTGLENHPETKTVVKEPTCKEEGAQDVYCSTCDMIVRTEPIETLEHTPGEWIPKAEGTCKEKATEVLICTQCGGEIEVRELELGDHSFGDWKVTTAATCNKEGVESRTCEVCGETKTRSIQKADHTYGDWNITVAATCSTEGSQSRTCSVCKNTETQSVNASGHSYGAWNETTEATCEGEGVQTHTCSKCGKSETQAIAALGHIHNHTSTFPHRNEGNEGTVEVGGTCNICIYMSCERCGAERIDHITGTAVSVYGEYVTQSTCNICGATAN